jgi:hypothetical protein
MGKKEKVPPAVFEITMTVRFEDPMTVKEINKASKRFDKAMMKVANTLAVSETATWVQPIEGESDGN